MGTTVEKLQKALDNKASIKQAITNKRGGIDIGENQSTWASEIESIEPLLDTINITSNGKVDIKNYRNANVLVESEADIQLKNFIERAKDVEIHIPYGITKIGAYAFFNSNLDYYSNKKVYIPSTIKEIGDNAFEFNGSSMLTVSSGNIYYDGDINSWAEIPKGRYTIATQSFYPFCGRTIKVYFNKDLEDVVVISPKSNVISMGAFYQMMFNNDGQTNKRKIKISKDVSSIGVYSFSSISWVSEIEFEEGSEMETIPFSTFNSCGGTNDNIKVILPICKKIEKNAFVNSNVQEVVFKEGLEEIGENAFRYSRKLNTLILPNSLKIIGYSSFENSGLTNVTIPENVEEISNYAFASVSNLVVNIEALEPFKLGSSGAFHISNLFRIYVPKGRSSAFKSATNWSRYANYIFEKYVVNFEIPTSLVNNENVTYSIDGGKTYQQFTNAVLSLNEVATIKIKSTDSTQTILIGTSVGGNDVGTISNSELTFSFTGDTTIYLTVQ